MRISGISDRLLDYANELLVLAEKEGAEEAEVFGVMGRSVDVDLRKDSVELASESFHRGLGLRAVVKGAVGFSSTSEMALLESVSRSAIRSAHARGKDESWHSLPHPEKIGMPKDIFDAQLEKIEPEECIDLALGMVQGCSEIKDVEPISGSVICASGTKFVMNSQGVELREGSTLMQATMEMIAKDGEVATGSEFHNSRILQPDLDHIGKAAAQMAKASLNGVKAESGYFDVLLKPLAFAELLEYTFIPSISSENVQKGRSALKGRVGDRISSENLSLVDDGLLSGGMDSSAFDGEGVPSRRTNLIEDGFLKGFLYDSYTAGKAGVQSTGNAVRSGYSEIPRVGIRNLVVKGESPFDLLEETKGLLVNGLIGAHTSNPISGDFSVEARNSFHVYPGEMGKPIRSMMLAGNVFEILKKIDIGNDSRVVGAIITPTIRTRLKVIGS